MVGHAGFGVEREQAEEETLRLRGVGVGLGALQEALDEVRAVVASELLDREAVDWAVVVEGRVVCGGLEEGDETVGVGLGADGGLSGGYWIGGGSG